MYTHTERDIYIHKYVSLHVFANTDVHLSECIYIYIYIHIKTIERCDVMLKPGEDQECPQFLTPQRYGWFHGYLHATRQAIAH